MLKGWRKFAFYFQLSYQLSRNHLVTCNTSEETVISKRYGPLRTLFVKLIHAICLLGISADTICQSMGMDIIYNRVFKIGLGSNIDSSVYKNVFKKGLHLISLFHCPVTQKTVLLHFVGFEI